ncbi:MAG: septal ring lytic transglycosylase RlpA family protein [Leptolyngbyaceae cyanobacterium bins.59]|nr:septal ring lytic transglycosylase RlpA family protein [Leptolyngbyaceae cyanobacterium bins.59]
MKTHRLSSLLLLLAISGFPAIVQAQQIVRGLATWYGPGFVGNRTANGEIFNPNALTAAHRSLPFGTEVRVTNPRNGRSVIVRINDRLGDPRIVIDLSQGAARAIGMTETSPVTMEILGTPISMKELLRKKRKALDE